VRTKEGRKEGKKEERRGDRMEGNGRNERPKENRG